MAESHLRAPRSALHVSAGLAIAYAIVGWISLQITAPPDYVAVVFPPAGIALSTLLIYGAGAWPGVFAGSIAVQLMASAQSGAIPPAWAIVLPAIGATLQALVGYWLARRMVGFPNALDTTRSISCFLLLVVPLSCLVATSVAVPTLIHTGVILPQDGLFNWWTWWVGDTLGTLIAAPLMFVFLGRPRELWRPRRFAVAFPLLVATVLTAAVYLAMRDSEEQRIRTEFMREAEGAATLVDKRLQAQLDMLLAIERFVALSPQLDRYLFREFAAPLLSRHPGTQNFSWNPYVPGAMRGTFEKHIQSTDRSDFTILDRDESRPERTAPAGAAEFYLPILYVEPFEQNRSVLGLNPLSIPASRRAIERALQSGRPHASESFTLTQERGTQRGVVVYHTVVGPTDEFLGRSPKSQGLVTGAFRMDDMLAATLTDIAHRQLEFCLVDLDASPGNRRLSGSEDCVSDRWMQGNPSRAYPVTFAERNWQIRLRANDTYMQGLRTWAAWTTIAVGLFATGTLGAFLLMTTGQARRISDLVARRTSELAATTWSLQEEQAALSRAQRIAKMGSWEIDPLNDRLICSEGLCNLLGLPPASMLSREGLLHSIARDDRVRLRNAIERLLLEPGAISMDCRTERVPDRILHLLIENDWTGTQLTRLRGTAQDVTDARKAEAEIQHLAHYDVLTGLPNRSLWLLRARAALQAAQRHHDTLAILFLDLDHFKTVNDSLGHATGDKLLISISRRLADSVREEDVLARLGGDEFVALLPRLTRPEDAATVAQKMLSALAAPIQIDGHELNLSVSIGIAIFPNDGDDVDTLLKHADIAMYGAKDVGRNNYQFFVADMNVRALERMMLESGLRRAIERDELVLHYQPQIDVVQNRVIGAEALVRWNHPELGLIMPDRFIPIAEDSRLIVPLGSWVLRAACRQQARWRDLGLGKLTVAINISALQFRRPDFVDDIRSILADSRANPDAIEFEITESVLMQPSEDLSQAMSQLRGLGLTLALDDFGTGYSSLAYLKRFPISRLKLDRSFIQDLPGDAEDAAVSSATLSMARDLGMHVVAEGVENAGQRDFLVERGCRFMQGYLFARPLPAEAFEEFLSSCPADPAGLS